MSIKPNQTCLRNDSFPKIIWMLWLQGWDEAPELAISCLASWVRNNPDYVIHALDRRSLKDFIPSLELEFILSTPKEFEAISDQIRLELLSRYGGVWADATSMCAKPLREWLPNHMGEGFFAFAKPGADRELSSWFLASQKNNYIVRRWRSASNKYWRKNSSRHSYFWLHELFSKLCSDDDFFRGIWSCAKKIPAQNPFHFSPNCSILKGEPNKFYLDSLIDPIVPVFKLTHKIEVDGSKDTLYSRLIKFGFGDIENKKPHGASMHFHARPNFKILVGWYGSFSGHGTIGDLESVQTLVSHLVGEGYSTSHATAGNFEIDGSTKVDWRNANPTQFDLIIFTCGPILRTHPETLEFLEKFKLQHLLGVGVSILDKTNPEFSNPFLKVFARQGMEENFGDLAIASPQVDDDPVCRKVYIGISLRGIQSEYGLSNCCWERVEKLIRNVSANIAREHQLEVIEIENHLHRSQIAPEEIEGLYRKCKLVITSRFHGAVLSAKFCIPFIAIDQIMGGAKVYDLLIRHPWKYIYRIDSLTEEIVRAAATKLVENSNQFDISLFGESLNRDANITLASLDYYLSEINS